MSRGMKPILQRYTTTGSKWYTVYGARPPGGGWEVAQKVLWTNIPDQQGVLNPLKSVKETALLRNPKHPSRQGVLNQLKSIEEAALASKGQDNLGTVSLWQRSQGS